MKNISGCSRPKGEPAQKIVTTRLQLSFEPGTLLVRLAYSAYSYAMNRLRQVFLAVLTVSMACAGPQPVIATGEHWAFAPVGVPPVPVSAAGQSGSSPIDAFVGAELARRHLRSAQPALPAELFRRLSFDLTGLPPSFEETETFKVAANEPGRFAGAVESAVDRFLASPAFGEKWARHWLDVARYADSKGYVFQEERRYPFAFGYRDWVIAAFNADMPYDDFIVAQIAADLVEDGAPENLAAIGYLTLGRRFLNREPDIIDDRIDVVTRGMLGLTVACARCHDHKYDPIPIEDYYSLYGVFQSSREPEELPLVGVPERTAEFERYESRLMELENALSDFKRERHAELLTVQSMSVYLVAAWDARELNRRELRRLAEDRKLYPSALSRWRDILFKEGAGSVLTLCREHLSSESPNDDAGERQKTLADVLGRFESDEIDEVLNATEGVSGLSPDVLVREYSVQNGNRVRKLQRAVAKFRATDEGAPVRAMALVDRNKPIEPVVFERGNPGRRGERVPRQFLSVLSSGERTPFSHGSGRLELAMAIADSANPLTARVMVNRIWMHLMGAPLVDSTSDFGVRTPAPAIPGLLDHLAATFVENGWSIKQLVRHIVLSKTYQQSTTGAPGVTGADPDNRLFARGARKRLPFEGLRDAMLAASGSIDRRMFGRAVELDANPWTARRTIYGFVDRQNLPGVFRTFDFAGPDAHCPKRHETTVPQQALFLMNNTFAQEMAEELATSPPVIAAGEEFQVRVQALYRVALARDPTSRESQLGVGFLEASLASGQDLDAAWAAFAQVLLSSNEFAYYD